LSSDPKQQLSSEGLVRGLGRWDATLLTVGAVIGTGIFITTADIARVCGIGRDRAQRVAYTLRALGFFETIGRDRDGVRYSRRDQPQA